MEEIRVRQRPAAMQRLVDMFEKRLSETKATESQKAEALLNLRKAFRDVLRRLRRYETDPPIFPMAVLSQIKQLHNFGTSKDVIATLYRVDQSRIDRVLRDQEMPLIIPNPIPDMPLRQRAVQV